MSRRQWVVIWNLSSLGVASNRTSEKENERLGLMNFVVDPAAGLLDSKVAPLLFVEQTTARHVAVYGLS